MTPAEQRVLDAARAYRDGVRGGSLALLDAAEAMPRTWPPPTVTDNPAEVVQGEVRETSPGFYVVKRFVLDGLADLGDDDEPWCAWPHEITRDRLVSRPGVDL